VLLIREGTTNILVLDALRVMHKESTQELLLSRIRSSSRARRRAAYTLASLDEHDGGVVDRLARLLELTLLSKRHGEYADRLKNRPRHASGARSF
jgi:hypothetical protein